MVTKILLVDSSSTECSIIKNTLSDYLVLTANNRLEAMSLIEENLDIYLLMLSLDMPSMEGFEVLRTIKSGDHFNKMRIIILTNCSDNEVKGLKMGAHDYIRRPFNLDSLKVRVDMNIEIIKTKHLLEENKSVLELTFNTIFDQAPIGITVSHNKEPNNNNSNDYFTVNKVFEQFTGRSKEELEKLGWGNITHPKDLNEEMAYFKKIQSGEINSYSMDKRYLRPDGSYVWGHMVVAKLAVNNSYKYTDICFVQDINERKEMEKALKESERSKSVLLSHLPGLAFRRNYDKNWTMQFVSDGCYDLTGYLPENLLNNRDISFNDLIAPEYRDFLWNEWKCALDKKSPFRCEYELMTASGERKWVLEMGQGIFNKLGEVESLEGIILDISHSKKFEIDLKYNNDHDTWTKLYNRSYFDKTLAKDAEINTKEKRALVSINLSSMYLLSMTYGFYYSQELIKKVADVLKLYTNDNIMLFNTSEYRFVFYIKAYKDKNDLVKFCEAIIIALEALLYTEKIGGGIGIVEIDDENKHDIDKLKKNLLLASERAISIYDRYFNYCFFDKDMYEKLMREEKIKHELSNIITEENNNLFLEFQPILDLKTHKINGFEALSRIKCDKFGIVSPAEFIPIAEKTKLMVPLGQKIIIHAFNFLNVLKNNGYDKTKVFINISAIQLQSMEFVKNLLETIDRMQVDPRNIVIEITESMFVTNYYELNNIFNDLKRYNIHIAIDDFGTGYSSLARERELNVDCIKIDKHFIDNLMILDESESIIGDIVSMFHKFGHTVIAEGVEHEKQKQYLIKHGCDKIQGYLISKPLDEEKAIQLLGTLGYSGDGP